MLIKILGWFWIISGVIFLLKPLWLRRRLQKAGVKRLRKIFFAVALALGLLLIKAAWGLPGFLAKILVVAGIMALLKAIFFLKAQASERLVAWVAEQPIKVLRLYAIGQIFFGALILSA